MYGVETADIKLWLHVQKYSVTSVSGSVQPSTVQFVNEFYVSMWLDHKDASQIFSRSGQSPVHFCVKYCLFIQLIDK